MSSVPASESADAGARSAAWAAVAAYLMWGLFPLYLKQLAAVPAWEVVAHRSAWSLLVVWAALLALRRWAWVGQLRRQPRTLAIFMLSALLLSCNWLLYVWAVANGRVLEASLGYFINPLFNVLLGFLVLRERPSPVQWTALGLAAAGVLWMALGAGQAPWVALTLAASFGLYGLLRKTAPLAALEGLALETSLLAPVAIAYLVYLSVLGQGHFAQGDAGLNGWLLAAGPLTALPLLLFAHGARRVSMATLGLLQYISPTTQLLLGIWLFHEPFDARRGLGFVLIWAGLLLYSAESWRQVRQVRQLRQSRQR